MPIPQSPPPKPVSTVWRPELVRLPRLHWRRRLFRTLVRGLSRLVLTLLTHAEIRGREHIPSTGPVLIAMNHLGDTDTPLVMATLPVAPEVLGKIELLHEFPVLGKLMDWYGTIWLHRGLPDRRALNCALQALEEGRDVLIAPEGRYTLIRGLEKGGDGAAWLALKAHVQIVPIALTGTRNETVYASLRSLRRPHLTLTAGEPFGLDETVVNSRALSDGTQRIMETLARMLPSEYRGVYAGPARV